MVTINGIPVYEATMTEGCGIQRVSLVDEPAVMSDFQKFAAEQAPRKYAIEDEEKRIVTGVIARADFPIYRYDKKWGEYYIVFSAETIRTIAERLLKDQKQGEVNLDHVDGSEVQDVDMVELFIKDSAKGISPEGFDDIADGSLFATYHVNNDEVWDAIKAGDYKGFSMEIIENDIPFEDAEKVMEIVETTEGKFSKIKSKMGKVSRKLLELAKELAKFGSVNTDKDVLFWDGDEDLEAGDKVFTDEERENAAEDGDYVTEDGKTIVVAGGEVSEIRDAEAEVATKENAAEQKLSAQKAFFKVVREHFSETYDEKVKKIAEAVIAAGFSEYGYILEAADDYAIFCYYGEETDWEDRYKRFDVSWDEDGNAVVSNPTDVKRAFVPVDSEAAPAPAVSDDDFAAMKAENESLKAENESLKSDIEAFKKKPAAKPAHQAFREKVQEEKANNFGRILNAKGM